MKNCCHVTVALIAALAALARPAFVREQEPQEVVIEVRAEGEVVPGAEIRIAGKELISGSDGKARLALPPGVFPLRVSAEGFQESGSTIEIQPGRVATFEIALVPLIHLEEEVIVTATRTERRLEDQPLRVEVVDSDDIEEKALMTPGSVAMLLSETTGLRVQTTAPSLGAANVRIQGLRGHYSQLLSDGLPLYGLQGGSLSLLQVPPLDLGQVEIIKGAASALHGPSALGGVIDLVSRRPTERRRELLFNETTQVGTDVSFLSMEPPGGSNWGYTLLGGVHTQKRQDLDEDGWTDVAGFRRGVLRPRFFWDDKQGRSVFTTVGVMAENRNGGTLSGGVAPDGSPFAESLSSRRFDAGTVARLAMGRDRLLSLRGSFTYRSERRGFGESLERGRRITGFGEAVFQGKSGPHSWLIGGAFQLDDYAAEDLPVFDYTFSTPGLIVQDEIDVSERFAVGISARADRHSRYGGFVSPRISLLYKPAEGWTARLSAGTGYFAPTPFVEETEETGLSSLQPFVRVEAERARSVSLDASWARGPFELVGTIFGSHIDHPLERRVSGADSIELLSAEGPVRTWGTEALARYRVEGLTLLFTHAFTRSREDDPSGGRRDTPLTPGQVFSFNAIWEDPRYLRLGFESYYTGRQNLDENPYRARSRGYLLCGVLAQRRLGRFLLFVNFENIGNIRQTRYDPLVRPSRAPDGRWTVDAWAPLDGRVINGGLRLTF